MPGSIIRKLKLRSAWQLYVMFLFPFVALLIFHYWPMLGFSLAFQNFKPTQGYFGSPWVGLDNFKKLINMSGVSRVVTNTVIISLLKLSTRLVFALIIALCLNEIRCMPFKKFYQSAALFPYFLSWVVLGNIFLDVFSTEGAAGAISRFFGVEPVSWLMQPGLFRTIIVATSDWKGYGYELVILIAALAGIDHTYYEAADIDGASHWQKLRFLTVPCILPTVMMLLIMSLGEVLNAGFEQILVMYNKAVFSSADVIDTYVYRLTFENAKYSLGTAVGLFKSVIGFILVISANALAKRVGNYQVL